MILLSSYSLRLTIGLFPCYRLSMDTHLLASLSLQQLRRAVALKERIAALEHELSQVAGAFASMTSVVRRGRKRKRSAATRARMSAAQKARWARSDGGVTRTRKRRRKMSPKARARLAAIARARWARAKASGRKSLAA